MKTYLLLFYRGETHRPYHIIQITSNYEDAVLRAAQDQMQMYQLDRLMLITLADVAPDESVHPEARVLVLADINRN